MASDVFIAYDFEIGGTLPGCLEAVASRDPSVEWPGAPDAASQGAVWNNKVRPGIERGDRLLAFLDLPNANVGFEVGYALGLGKAVALARVRPDLPDWLNQPPLNGFLCPCLETPQEVRTALRSPPEEWVRLTDGPAGGPGVLLLCPPRTGAHYLEQVPEEWGWQTWPPHGWDLHALPERLRDVGLVVWVIAPHNEGKAGRDGRENAALSVIAGYAEARPELELRVLHDRGARAVVDVVANANRRPFAGLAALRECLDDIAAGWANRHAEAAGGEPAAVVPERPALIEPLPPDDWGDVPARFLGRQLQLADAGDAVQGVLHRARAGQEPEGGRAVSVVWAHGFGGMGKSWFLHRARLRAAPAVRALVVDWDSPDWRYPLAGEPRCAEELFKPIAWRLAQACGTDAADPYWLAKAKVRAEARTHQELKDRFEGQIALAAGPERVDSRVVHRLQQEGIWRDDPAQRLRELEKWRGDAARWTLTFEAWCHESYRVTDAAIEPDRVLADGLREALRQAAERQPLLLLLDTGEVLSPDLDRWLRRLLVPLCRGATPLLVLVGSRLPPDLHLPQGSREGWQAELPRQRFRAVPFAESVRFTVEEIEAALGQLRRPVAGDHAALAERLHRVTRGVPLALRALLDLHEEADGGPVLSDLVAAKDDEGPLEESEAVRAVVGTVARRLLYHLERRPEREQDLRDVVALALLPRADHALLARLWRGQSVHQRLRRLGARYSLVSGGDLHPTVRDYLRRHWRGEERPAVFEEVLAALGEALAALPPVGDGGAEARARTVQECNLAAWRLGDAAVPELARCLAEALAYEEGVDDLQGLLSELPLAGVGLAEARKVWKRPAPADGKPGDRARGVRGWLRGTCDASADWPERQRACLALVEGIAASSWEMKPAAALGAVALLTTALDYFGAEGLPQRQKAGESFFDLARALDPYWNKDEQWAAEAEVAYRCAIALRVKEVNCLTNLGHLNHVYLKRFDEAEQVYRLALEIDPAYALAHNNLGVLCYDLKRYDEAEREYRRAIELDPKLTMPHNNLGALCYNLRRYDEAEREYCRAIELDPALALAHTNLGNLYKDLKRYGEAEAAYRRAAELDPKSAATRRQLGSLYKDLKRYDEAEQEYHRAAELMPNAALTHNELGVLYRDLKRHDEAERACRRAQELDPKLAPAHNNLGTLCYDLKRYDEAEREYRLALEIDPAYALAHNNLGALCYDLKRYDEAEREYCRAIELDPAFALARTNLGNLYNNLKRYDEAESEYRRAAELDPNSVTTHNSLGHLHYICKRYDEAERAYRRALEIDPAYALAHNNLGALCYDLKRYDEAEREYCRAIELDAAFALAHTNLGNLYKDLKRYGEAEAAYRRAAGLDPQYAYAHSGLGVVYYALGRYAEAEAAYRRALELDPQSAVLHDSLGDVYKALGRPGEAEAAYRRAVDLDPNYAIAHNDLGNLYLALRRYAEAEAAYLRAAGLDPQYAYAHSGLGVVYYALGRYAEAEQEYCRAIELDPQYATAHASLGHLYQELNRPDEAERCYRRALEVAPDDGGAHRGLTWLCLLSKGDKDQARTHAQLAMQQEPEHAASPLTILAVTTWTTGWAEARSSMPEWLAKCDSWVAASSRFRIVALLREVRRQGGLGDCATMLRAVEDRPWWKPWSEAVDALAGGKGPEACTTPEATELYQELSRP